MDSETLELQKSEIKDLQKRQVFQKVKEIMISNLFLATN